MSIKWYFPSTGGGRKAGLNDSGIETFKDKPIRSLAREICQNSLDAAIKGKVDELVGLKENLMIGKQMPAGTGFHLIKNVEPIREEELNKTYSAMDENTSKLFEEIDEF